MPRQLRIPKGYTQRLRKDAAAELAKRALPGAPVFVFVYGIALLATPLYDDHTAFAIGCGLVMLIAAVVRTIVSLHIIEAHRRERPFSMVLFYLCTYSLTVSWGALCCAVSIWYGTSAVGMLIYLMMSGIAAAGSIAYTPRFSLGRNSLLILLIPSMVILFAIDDAKAPFIGFVTLAYMSYLLVQMRTHYRWYWQAVIDNAELEIKTIELEDKTEQLGKAKSIAEAASRAKSEFLANVSHEIRTPLNGVLGMIELLLGSELTAEQQSQVRIAQTSGKTLLSIIDDILDFAKIEAGRADLLRVPFDLQVCLDQVAGLLSHEAYGKGVELVISYPHDALRRFLGDPGRIRQIVTNLTSNAIKFTEQGYVLIRVSSCQERPGLARVSITIEDTGIGIPRKQQEKIFRKFTQADGSISRRYGGTGLGLAITRELVELMSGEIAVHSEPGRGAVFTVSLPLTQAKQLSGQAVVVPDELRDARVLVVDDMSVNREAVGYQLKATNLDYEDAGSAEEALIALKTAARASLPFTILVVDSEMPGMDGAALVNKIRFGGDTGVEIILVLVPPGGLHDTSRYSGLEVSAFLSKPVGQDQIARSLRAVCQARAFGSTEKNSNAAIRVPSPFGQESAADSPASAGTFARGEFRVLLVEDNKESQVVGQQMLTRLGCEVEVVADGRAAISRVSEKEFDLVLMDCQMGDMDGLETARRIRLIERDRARTAIVAMTANLLPSVKQACFRAGMDDYLSKPIEMAALKELLGRVSQSS